MIARVSIVISIYTILLLGCATGTSAPTVTMSEEDAELAVYNYLYDTAVTGHGKQVLAAYMDASNWGGEWPSNELTDRGWYIFDYKYKGDIDDIEAQHLSQDLFDQTTWGECYEFYWLVEPDGKVLSANGNAWMLVIELTKDCGAAALSEQEAREAVYLHVVVYLEKSSHGKEVWAAYHDASWSDGQWPTNECANDVWRIYWVKDRYAIEDEPLLTDIFENPIYDGYSCCWLVNSSGEVIAFGGNAMRLEAELIGD